MLQVKVYCHYQYVDDFISSKDYSKLTDNEKVSVIKKMYDLANAQSKEAVTGGNYVKDEQAKIVKAMDYGIKPAEYLTIKNAS